MGRRELKAKHSDIDYSVIDILHKIDTTGKMVPFLIKQVKNAINNNKLTESLKRRGGQLDLSSTISIESDDILSKVLIDTIATGFVGRSNVQTLSKFTKHLENKRIENSDITQYKTWSDIIKATTNADVKQLEKELQSSIIKVIDTEEWLMVRPLTFEASLKYGANTKWCTASRENKSYFYSYSAEGPLIYIFDKSTGSRFGVCNRPNSDGITVWTETDKQIDSAMMNLPTDIYMLLVETLKDKPNSKYFSEEELKFYLGGEKQMSIPPPIFGNILADSAPFMNEEVMEYEEEVMEGDSEDFGYDEEYVNVGSDEMVEPSVGMVETDYSSEPQSGN